MKNYTKLPLVLLLLLTYSAVSAQGISNIELFKSNKETTVYAPDFNNLLKIENQHDFRSFENKEAFDMSNSSYEDMPRIDKYYPRRGTRNFVNLYLGLNNYLEDDKLPSSSELYSLNPINSWYGGINFDNITHVVSVLYLDWGIGASVQEFAFENTRTRLNITDDSVTFFEQADVKGRKSKIKMWHLNVHMVPTLAFGRYDAFRVGFGMYGGYRLDSSVIYKYDDANGNKQKEKNRGQSNLNQFRYGMRATLGWNFFDVFFNYEMTDLFEDSVSAPRLTPVTFGFIF